MNRFYLYILSSRHHRYLSVGVTPDLAGGIRRHRVQTNRLLKKRHVLQKLVYVESIIGVDEAVERELELRSAPKARLHALIESVNPGWDRISVSALVNAGFDRSVQSRVEF